MKKAIIGKALGNYITLEIDATYVPEILSRLKDLLGRGGEDVADTIRMVKNFDTFYEFMVKKFKEYLVPKKELSDLIRGNVIVCLLYTSPSPRDLSTSRMPSSA